jgi:hypothetical protein
MSKRSAVGFGGTKPKVWPDSKMLPDLVVQRKPHRHIDSNYWRLFGVGREPWTSPFRFGHCSG